MSTASPAKSRSNAGSKASGNPLDAPALHTRNPSQKSWAGPSSQRSSTPSHQNGLNARTNGQTTPPTLPNNQALDTKAHDRMLFLLANSTGLDATLTLTNGDKYTGMFSGATSVPPRYILKMVRLVNQPGIMLGQGDDHVMSFDIRDTIDLAVLNPSLSTLTTKSTSSTTPSFKTDTEISRNATKFQERELHRWQPGADNDFDLSLDGADKSGGIGNWDQFAANEKLTKVRSDFDENLYTTVIDRSDPKYKQSEQRAAKLAREIERESMSRSRGNEVDSGLDEEDKYSGVIRTPATHGKAAQEVYVPPSRRPAQGKTPTSAAPYDPAIISSQLARPNASQSPAIDSERRIRQGVGSAVASVTPVSATALKPAQAIGDKLTSTNPAAPVAVQDAAVATTGATKAEQSHTPKKSDNYYQDVYESFKQFSNAEKQRLHNHQRAVQQQRSTTARQEKSVKLNDLKQFAQSFKLHSRVPEDLVPILAKTKEKQDEIRVKAEQQARDKEQQIVDDKSATTTVGSDQGPSAVATKNGSTSSHEAADKAKPRERGELALVNKSSGTVKPPSIDQPSSAAYQKPSLASGLPSLSAATLPRLNVKAMEFRPNPGAAAFAPFGATSPQRPPSKRPSVSTQSPITFIQPAVGFSFGRPPLPADQLRPSFDDLYNPLQLMLRETNADESKKAQFASNGGIPQAYRTAPTWDVPVHHEDKSYMDFFASHPTHTPIPLSRTHSNSGGMMPHQPHLPPHLQGGPSSGQHSPRYYHVQPQYAQSSPEEQRAHSGQSNNGSLLRSYKNGPQSMMYNGQVHAQMHGGFAYGAPGGVHMRPQGSNGKYMAAPMSPMGGHMMMQQPSNGPYPNMAMPQQQMSMCSSPGPNHAQPHLAGHGGYPGHPMTHHNSQQGGQHAGYGMPMMSMGQQSGQVTSMRNTNQAHFGGQHGPQSYAMQHRVMSGQGSNHSTPRQQSLAQQGQIPGAIIRQHSNAGDEQR